MTAVADSTAGSSRERMPGWVPKAIVTFWLGLAVLWLAKGIAHSLHDLVLAGRPEERATVTVRPAATAAQQALRSWGWQRVGRTRDPDDPGSPVSDVLVIPLPLR